MNEPVEGTSKRLPVDVRRQTPAPVFAAGDTVPNLSSWVLERNLGGGGFGEVWLARHAFRPEEKLRAVKFCTDPDARHRLVTHEQNVVRRVMKYAGGHPNIVPLLECNLDGDIPWLMYEFVEGGTLAGLVAEWRELAMPKRLGRAVRVLHAIAGALATCHRFDPPLGHRDMKPQNVLMAGSVPRITDFGIGSVVLQPQDGAATSAHTAYVARVPTSLQGAGTRLYAPAEQTLGSPPNPRDDVYALGIIAYQLVTADLTTGPGADASLELRDLKIPGELASLIIRSAALDPNRRPKDATEWETTLAALIEKARKQPDTDVTGSKPVILPEPAEPTAVLPARSGPPPLPPIPFDLLPKPPIARPARGKSGRLVAKALGGVLVLALAVTVVIALLPSGKRTEPTSPSAALDMPKIEIADGVKMTFCWVPAGECQLGSPKAERDAVLKAISATKEPEWLESDAEAARGKFKTNGFWMGKYTVTQAEWTAVMGINPSRFDGKKDNKAKGMDTSRFPVESVSWDMICGQDGKGGFLAKVNAHGGIQKAFGKPGTFALPHEDMWEYACRGGLGNAQPFHFGKELDGTKANFDSDFPFGTATKIKALDRPTPVGEYEKKVPHPWGLCDMHGNVYQWCENYYDKTNISRVLRGGSWYSDAHYCRAAYRNYYAPDYGNDLVGFRLVQSLDL